MSRKYFFRFSKSAHTLRYTILDSRDPLAMRSRKAGLPFATRAWKRELSIQEVRFENDSDRKFSKSKFSKFFWKPLFSTIHGTLITLSQKYFFRFSKSAHTLRYTILDSRDPLVMRSQKAGLPFATRAWKRELSIQEVRIENDSDRKCFKSNFFPSFSENHFFLRFMLPWSLWAENIFSN